MRVLWGFALFGAACMKQGFHLVSYGFIGALGHLGLKQFLDFQTVP
jgi:hypothetical protein